MKTTVEVLSFPLIITRNQSMCRCINMYYYNLYILYYKWYVLIDILVSTTHVQPAQPAPFVWQTSIRYGSRVSEEPCLGDQVLVAVKTCEEENQRVIKNDQGLPLVCVKGTYQPVDGEWWQSIGGVMIWYRRGPLEFGLRPRTCMRHSCAQNFVI